MSEFTMDRLRENLEALKMKNTLEILDNYLERAVAENLSIVDVLDHVFAEEAKSKRKRAYEKQIQMSGFPIKKTLDDFDFSFQPSIDKPQIDELATMRFLENGENVVFLGPPGVGLLIPVPPPPKNDKISSAFSYNFKLALTPVSVKVSAHKTDDTMKWKSATLPSSAVWQSVTYGDGKFVAVAYNSNKIAYSADGITWTAATLPFYASVSSWFVTYGDGKFVAVSYGGTKSAYSVDGITWTETAMPFSENWYSVAYGDGKFVAVAENIDKAAYGEDGITWTEAAMPFSENWQSVTYGDGKFVAVASSSNQAAYTAQPLGGIVSYQYEYSTNGGNSWASAGGPTTDTEKDIVVPEKAEQFMARVRAQDDMGFVSNDYVIGPNVPVQTMRLWVGVDNRANPGKKLWVGVDGKARRVVRAWVGDENGKARRWF